MITFRTSSIVTAGALAASLVSSPPALADSQEAHCTLYQGGQQKDHGTGRCDFYQSQGNVEITLRDGKRYDLRIGEMSGEYFDGQQNSVMRRINDKGRLVFKWPRQEIVVNLNESALSGGHGSGQGSGSGSRAAGQDVTELSYLVGRDGGYGEDELLKNGYELANYEESGADVYSNFENRRTGTCITVRSTDGIYRSVAYSTEYDCNKR